MRTQTPGSSLQSPEPGPKRTMARPRPLVLLWVLLTLCVSAGTPEVWVQVQMEATKLPSFTVRCGFLGSGSISLVTVSWGGPDGAGGTNLAVLHPEFGTQQWAPVRQVHWETKSSVSLTLEGSGARSPAANTTFCCKFVSFPNGSREACGDKGLPAPSPALIPRADLAGISGASGVLLCGCIFILYLKHRRTHRSVARLQPPLASTQTQRRAQATSQVSLNAVHLPYSPTSFSPAALDTGHPHQQLSRWALLPIHTARQPQVPATWASPLASPCSGFVSVENGLYAWAGQRPPCTGSNLSPSPHSLGSKVMEGHLGL